MKFHLSTCVAAIALLAVSWTATTAWAQGYPAPGMGYPAPGYGAAYGGYQPGMAAQQAFYAEQSGPMGGIPSGVMRAAPQYFDDDPIYSQPYGVDLACHCQSCDCGGGCSSGGCDCSGCSQSCGSCGGGDCGKCGGRIFGRFGLGLGGDGGMFGDGGIYGDPGMCGYCGGAGCGKCKGLLGGCGHSGCCNPRWWDIYSDVLYLRRDNAGRGIPLTSDGISGPTVLSTDDIDFDYEFGFRFGAAILIGVGTNIEFQYMGTLHWNGSNYAESGSGELYSAFSNFGADANIGDSTFDDSEEADLHVISYSSDLNTYELSWRKRMVSPNCRIHTSFLAGVRHVQLDEDFNFYSEGRADNLNYFVGTSNEMTGFQMGGDLWFCIIPRLMVGADLKAGVYGNHADQVTVIENGTGTTNEAYKQDDVAFLGEANVTCIFKITPRWTLRGGVQSLYLDGVALANENYNPVEEINGRTVGINDNGSVFYYGGFAGLEFIW